MNISVMLFTTAIPLVWLGSIVLFIGRKEGVSFGELVIRGRRVYGELDRYFSRANIIIFKLCSYVGLVLFILGIAAVILEK
jgi:hypothetical protein